MTATRPFPESALRALRDSLGADAVIRTPEPYLHEPRALFTGHSPYLCTPGSTEAVVQTVRICASHRIPILPYGGGTGLVGGQIDTAVRPSLLLSTEKLNEVRRVDATDSLMVCAAGVTLHDAQKHAETQSMLFPLSLASEGSCTVGGNLATNAGGVNVLRYGNARALCLGVEAVLANGSVLNDLGGLRKDNTGYALSQLLVGSEGTLGIITAAALRLFPMPQERVATLAAVISPRNALALLDRLQQTFGERVSAFELIAHQGIAFLAEAGIEHRMPLDYDSPWYVLTEVASGKDPELRDRVESTLSDAVESGDLLDAILSTSETQRRDLWHMRESIPEANRLIGSVASFDISIPIASIPVFIEETSASLLSLEPSLRINCFGHLGDGNLHFNSFPPAGANRSTLSHLTAELNRRVYDMVYAHGGSFSAEHGVGRQKTAQLEQFVDPGRIEAMRLIKHALDPLNILNPGAILAE